MSKKEQLENIIKDFKEWFKNKPSPDPEQFQKQLDKQKEDLDWTQKIVKGTQWFIAGILLICFLAFLGFLYDYLRFTSENRQRFHDKLEQMEDTLQQQKDDRQDQEIKHLKEQIDELKDGSQPSPNTSDKEKQK